MDLLYKSNDNSANSYIDKEFNYYLVRLQNKVNEEDYKAAYSAVLNIYQANPYTKIILSMVDNEEHPLSIPFSARSWFASYFSPKFYTMTDKNPTIAIVKPQTKFQTNMMNVIIGVIEKSNITVKTEYFDNEEQAKEWIAKIN